MGAEVQILGGSERLKKILVVIAVVAFTLVLSKLANTVPTSQPDGTSFTLNGAHVVECSESEIVLVDKRQTAMRLLKDASWPDCSNFESNQVADFFLSRGEKTHFIGTEETAWWRKGL